MKKISFWLQPSNSYASTTLGQACWQGPQLVKKKSINTYWPPSRISNRLISVPWQSVAVKSTALVRGHCAKTLTPITKANIIVNNFFISIKIKSLTY